VEVDVVDLRAVLETEDIVVLLGKLYRVKLTSNLTLDPLCHSLSLEKT
jgi:hypothetical protein